jgi:hypothetical protein
MRIVAAAILLSAAGALASPALAQTQSSGASGTLKGQDKAAITAQPPNQPYKQGEGASAPTGAQNSGAGIAGAPGNKNGPAAHQGTVGSNAQDKSVQEAAKVQGVPGNKSGPPAKR